MLRARTAHADESPRAAAHTGASASASSLFPPTRAGGSGGHRPPRAHQYSDDDKKKGDPTHRTSVYRVAVSCLTALLITLLVYGLVPRDSALGREAAQVAEAALAAEHELEREMMDWWSRNGHHQPPLPQEAEAEDPAAAAVERDAPREGRPPKHSWVEGEKKLKQKLKILAERQSQGKDIGVPVLTRWLGDDFPVWAGEGVDVEEWRRKIDEKYTQMRQEEDEWRREISAILDRDSTRA